MYALNDTLWFPDIGLASSDGLLAIGGDLRPERLLLAYKSGIFPWFNTNDPILWWSPDPRFVLFPKDLKISKSMKQVLKSKKYTVTFNTAFEAVIEQCALIKRKGQNDTWITADMKKAYINMHALGYAVSVEVWNKTTLVGGFYGIDIGNNVFCGESMFSKESNTSKLALIILIKSNKYKLIDCQVHTEHLERLGAKHVSRKAFLKYL